MAKTKKRWGFHWRVLWLPLSLLSCVALWKVHWKPWFKRGFQMELYIPCFVIQPLSCGDCNILNQGLPMQVIFSDCQNQFACTIIKAGCGFKHFYFYPYLGRLSILTNIFQLGWNHQSESISTLFWKETHHPLFAPWKPRDFSPNSEAFTLAESEVPERVERVAPLRELLEDPPDEDVMTRLEVRNFSATKNQGYEGGELMSQGWGVLLYKILQS